MKCPHCKTKINPEVLIACLASDGSYATAEYTCGKCKSELELYYPLKEIDGDTNF